MVSFPYHSHTIPISLGILMGIVWEAYHKGVQLLGVPENPTDSISQVGSSPHVALKIKKT